MTLLFKYIDNVDSILIWLFWDAAHESVAYPCPLVLYFCQKHKFELLIWPLKRPLLPIAITLFINDWQTPVATCVTFNDVVILLLTVHIF